MNEIPECILCYGNNNLIKNNVCQCNYYLHKECLLLWIKTSAKQTCIMCQELINTQQIILNNNIVNINDELDHYISINNTGLDDPVEIDNNDAVRPPLYVEICTEIFTFLGYVTVIGIIIVFLFNIKVNIK